MREVTYGGAVSLDGFLAGPDGAIDWLHFSKDVEQAMAEYWKGIDTILMGRKTYEFAVSHGGRWPGQPMRACVFSRTLREIDDSQVELIRDDAAEFLRGLKRQPGGEICLMGGGELAQSLLAEGLVDRVRLNIHPVLLGSGIPTFRDAGKRVHLKLENCRTIDGGCLLAYYDVLTEK
jgi:dihydrofolate reductase